LERLGHELVRETGLILILDYDGTLTPIVPSPQEANLSPSVRDTLRRLAENPRVRLAILSGRTLRDIRARVGLKKVVYGGCHGLEIRGAGVRFKYPLANTKLRQLSRASGVLASGLERFPGALLERKGLTVSLHYRRVPPGQQRALLDFAAGVARQAPGLMSLPGKNVLELLPRVRWGKGEAVLWIRRRLAQALRSRPTITVYAGDDATDATAFAALEGRGVTVRVGGHRDRADHAVENVRAIHALLRWLARTIG
jgi:trehalose-phosphatase